jgi:hypothetical protein
MIVCTADGRDLDAHPRWVMLHVQVPFNVPNTPGIEEMFKRNTHQISMATCNTFARSLSGVCPLAAHTLARAALEND